MSEEKKVGGEVTHCVCLFDAMDTPIKWCGPYAAMRDALTAAKARIAELEQPGEVAAYLVNYYEETKGGGKRNVLMASLEPHEPYCVEPGIERRELIKAEPLYTNPQPNEGMVKVALKEVWDAFNTLSFHCDGVTQADAPPMEIYNETFAVIKKWRPRISALLTPK